MASEANKSQTGKLSGKRIVVTRSSQHSGELKNKLQTLGAEVLELPLITAELNVEPDAVVEIMAHIATYEWIIFTSRNGVRFFFDVFFKTFKDIRCIGPARFACVGKATARELERYHFEVDLVPEPHTSEALALALIETGSLPSTNVLVVTGNLNSPELPKKLETEGEAIVDTFAVYKTTKTDLSQHEAAKDFRQHGADVITFTSTSTVESFVEQAQALQLSPTAQHPKAVSIGPVTTEAMKAKKLPVAAEAEEANLDALVQAVINLL